jgi:hypothetical protein
MRSPGQRFDGLRNGMGDVERGVGAMPVSTHDISM